MKAILIRPVLAATLLLVFGVAPASAQRIKLPLSLQELEARVQADSNDAAAHYNVSLAYWNEKRFDDAEKSLKTAVQIDPRFAPAHLALAYLPYARRPKLWDEVWDREVPSEMVAAVEESDREYRQAFVIDPLLDLRIIGAVTPSTPDFLLVKDYLGEAYALFFQGFTDCQEGRYQDCHGRFVALIREIKGDRHPDRVPNSVLWYKGLAAAHLGKFDIAEEHFRQLIDRAHADSIQRENRSELSRVPLRLNEFRYALATILQAESKTTDAITLYQQVLEQDAGLYMAHVRLAAIYEAARDYPHAAAERLNAVNANPDDASLQMDLGITLGKAGMMPQAETHFQQAIDANPRDIRPLFWRGLSEFEQGKKEAAKESFTRFLAQAPSRYDRQIAMAKDRLARLQ
jgi:tetratricopeptide (TPR) repeat protein